MRRLLVSKGHLGGLLRKIPLKSETTWHAIQTWAFKIFETGENLVLHWSTFGKAGSFPLMRGGIKCWRECKANERRGLLFSHYTCGEQLDNKNSHILPTGQWYAPSAVNNDAWYCMEFHGIGLYWIVLHGIALYCMVLHGIAWFYMVLHYLAWYCIVLHGIAWYCLLLHDISWY